MTSYAKASSMPPDNLRESNIVFYRVVRCFTPYQLNSLCLNREIAESCLIQVRYPYGITPPGIEIGWFHLYQTIPYVEFFTVLPCFSRFISNLLFMRNRHLSRVSKHYQVEKQGNRSTSIILVDPDSRQLNSLTVNRFNWPSIIFFFLFNEIDGQLRKLTVNEIDWR